MFTVSAARDADKGHTWCAAVALGTEPHALHQSCRRRVEPRQVEADYRLVCATKDLFIYGAMPPPVRSVRVVRRGEPPVGATRYAEPARVAVGGDPFLISTAAGVSGRVEALDADGGVIKRLRLPSHAALCETTTPDPVAFGSL